MALLETARQRSAELEFVERRINKRVQEIVRSYRNSWDLYSELIQNSVDAINRRFRILNDPSFYLYDKYRNNYDNIESDPSYHGRINIFIDVPNRTIRIRDNGVGIRPARLEDFLLPEGTDKEVGQEYGFKGYGLTYAAFISERVEISSKYFTGIEEHNQIVLEGLFDWLSSDGNVDFPNGPVEDVSSTNDVPNEWNTEIKISLASDYSDRFPAISACDSALDYARDAQYYDGLEYMLRTRTAIGNTLPLFNKAPIVPIDITLDVAYPDGTDITENNIPYRYYHPKDHDQIEFLSFEFENYYDKYKNPSFDRDFRALYEKLTSIEVGSRNPIECDYALTAIASNRLGDIESSMGLDDIEAGDIGISYGVHLAIDGMPLGLRVDNWDSKGGNIKRYHVIVNAELDVSNQLDSGRKGISRYYGRLMSDKALDLISSTTVQDSKPFASYASRHLDHGRGRSGGGLPPQDFQDKISNTREIGEQQSQLLKEKLFSISNLVYLPTDEQEVVALFYQMLESEIIKGYDIIYHSGSSAVYDCAYHYSIECSEDNIYPNDSLGIGRVLVEDLKSSGLKSYDHKDHYSRTTYFPELCVEFKRDVGSLLDEVINRPSRSSKDVDAIDLLVCWDDNVPSSIPQASYTLDPMAGNRRIFHGTTHRLGVYNPSSTEIPCIVLKEIVDDLIDLDESSR
jgi:hypothetical protein